MNTISIVGRTTVDIEVKTQGETKFATFQIAVRRNFKNSKGEYESDFIPCIISGKPAEILAQYVKKGNKIAVRGALRSQTRTEGEGENATSKTFYSVSVEDFEFLEPKAPEPVKAEVEDELPFDN
jgi:single-strand DNA-binding protein